MKNKIKKKNIECAIRITEPASIKNEFRVSTGSKVAVQFLKIQTLTGEFVRETDNHLIFSLWDNKYKKKYYKFIHKKELRGMKVFHDGSNISDIED